MEHEEPSSPQVSGTFVRTSIDLSVIREHLTHIENALLLSYRVLSARGAPQEQITCLVEAMDRIQECKRAFGMDSVSRPVTQQKSAILRTYITDLSHYHHQEGDPST